MATDITIADVSIMDLIQQATNSQRGEAAPVRLWFDPQAREARLETWERINGTTSGEWHLRWYAIEVNTYGGPVDGPNTVRWLRGEEMQSLLRAIADGHSVEWNGSNHVGALTEDAEQALDELREALRDAPALNGTAGVYSAGDWYESETNAQVCARLSITAETTDDAIADMANSEAAIARHEYAVVSGIYDYLIDIRDRLW